MIRTLFVLLLAAALVLPASAALPIDAQIHGQAGPTPIDDCQVITEPGTYVLTDDITGGGNGNFTFISQTCLVVESDDVVIDGQGHQVDGTGVSDTTGIAVVGGSNDTVDNVTVSDVTVTDWNRGIYFGHTENGTIREVTAVSNAYGMSVEGSNGTDLTRSTANDNLIGVYEGPNSSDTALSEMSFDGNYAGDSVSDAEPATDERSDDESETADDESELTSDGETTDDRETTAD